MALCVGLLGAKAWGFLQQHRTLRSALASAKHGVTQLAGEGQEAAVAAPPAGVGRVQAAHVQAAHAQLAPTAAGMVPGPVAAASAQQERTPVIGARQQAEVSPLIHRGERGAWQAQPLALVEGCL